MDVEGLRTISVRTSAPLIRGRWNIWVAGKVISPVMKTLPLEDFKEALSMIVARQVQGRVILTTR